MVLSNENRGGQKWYQSIFIGKLSCQQVSFSGPKWTPSQEKDKLIKAS